MFREPTFCEENHVNDDSETRERNKKLEFLFNSTLPVSLQVSLESK